MNLLREASKPLFKLSCAVSVIYSIYISNIYHYEPHNIKNANVHMNDLKYCKDLYETPKYHPDKRYHESMFKWHMNSKSTFNEQRIIHNNFYKEKIQDELTNLKKEELNMKNDCEEFSKFVSSY